jgi:hypothetical protein
MPRNLPGVCAAIALAVAQRPALERGWLAVVMRDVDAQLKR